MTPTPPPPPARPMFCAVGGVDKAADDPWQPIETAPKDGTTVLVATRDEDAPVISAYWQQDAWFHGWMVWSCRSDGWQVAPTHWMPLPPPPASVKP